MKRATGAGLVRRVGITFVLVGWIAIFGSLGPSDTTFGPQSSAAANTPPCVDNGNGTFTCSLNADHVGAQNPGFDTGNSDECPAPDGIDVPAPPNDWAWHFVAPSANFIALTVTFLHAGVVSGSATSGGSWTNPNIQSFPSYQHAYIFTAQGDTLLGGSAVVSDDSKKFNLSHVCPGTTTSTTTTPTTTTPTTAPSTTTTPTTAPSTTTTPTTAPSTTTTPTTAPSTTTTPTTAPPTTTTPTTAPSTTTTPTTTPSTTTTPTTTPSTTTTPTTTPSTTLFSGGTTTTTSPATTSTTSVSATTVVAGGSTTTSQVAGVVVTALPQTGGPLMPLFVGGCVAMLVGIGLVGATFRPRRDPV